MKKSPARHLKRKSHSQVLAVSPQVAMTKIFIIAVALAIAFLILEYFTSYNLVVSKPLTGSERIPQNAKVQLTNPQAGNPLGRSLN